MAGQKKLVLKSVRRKVYRGVIHILSLIKYYNFNFRVLNFYM